MPAGAALLLVMTAAAPTGSLDWLAGARCTEGVAAESCERWSPMAGGTMLGTGQTVKDGRTVSFEFMRISLEDGPNGNRAVFHGSPQGAPAVPFREVERGPQSIAFANPAHDFPQRIAYHRDGEALIAEVSLLDRSKAQRWRFSRTLED